jgi:threonine synthase
MFMLGYRCVVCGREIAERGLVYTCGTCGGNLEVVHDLARLACEAILGPQDLRRYHPFLGLPREYSPAMPVRVTPLRDVSDRLPGLEGLRLLIKDETGHPSASFKDRASYVALAKAIEWRAERVVGASTGNAGASMACLAAAARVPATIFVPASAPRAKLAQMLAFGADLKPVEGSYDDAFEASLAVTRERGWFNRNTGFNPWTREGKKSVAFELWEQLNGGSPDWVVVPTGDGNILTGVEKGFRELHGMGWLSRVPRLLAAQASGSDAIASAWEVRRARPDLPLPQALRPIQADTVADSISVGLPRDGLAAVRALERSQGAALRVPDSAILDAVLGVACHTGVFVEPAAGCGFAALSEARRQGLVRPGECVVVLATGSGLKDVSAVLSRLPRP